MIILGFLLVIGAVGLALAVLWANDGVFAASAGTIELFGYQTNTTVGQVFLAGAAAGAVTLLGVLMLFNGVGRSARRRSAARHEVRAHQEEVRELQRKHDAIAADRAAQPTADDESSVDRDKAHSSRH